jgi:hypothetical protein
MSRSKGITWIEDAEKRAAEEKKRLVLMRVEMSGCWMNLCEKNLHKLQPYQVL